MSAIFDLVYLAITCAISPWIAWRYLFQGKNRRGWGQKLFGLAPIRQSQRPCVWIHAVSVGEVNLLKPLVDELLERFPKFEIVISTTTETGYDLAQKKYADQTVFFCPADFSWAVKNTIARIKPSVLLLTELEIWPNLVSISRSKNIPVALINGRISEKSYRGYQRLRWLFTWLVKQLNLAIVQTEDYASRLQHIGMPSDKISICGNLKFDQLAGGAAERTIQPFMSAVGIRSDQFLFVAGSTQENEDRIAISVYEKLKPNFKNLRMVLVPRHPDRAHRLGRILTESSLPAVFRSKSNIEVPDAVVVVDVIGELQQWWSQAHLAYVGGSMGGRGGQNMIEPAAFAVPVCFGPFTENFNDVVDLLLNQQAARVVHDSDQLEAVLTQALQLDPEIAAMAKRGQTLVQTQRGSTKATVNRLSTILRAVANGSFTSQKAA